MRKLATLGLLIGLAGCAAGVGTPPAVGSGAAAGATAPTTNFEGLAVRFFQCDNGAAFTTENFADGRFRLKTREVGYDLRASGDAFVGDGVTFRRQGAMATLEGAAGGPYVNCRQS